MPSPLALGLLVLSASAALADGGDSAVQLLPRGEIFRPLLADPSWPRFSAEHQWRGGDAFDRVAQVSFGESIALVRGGEPDRRRWEIGFQAQVDAIFDTTARSFDLANEDYYVALTGSFELGGFTTQLRVAHFSAHVGDEFLIENGGGRESVSWESVDVLADRMLPGGVRAYGGVGVLLGPNPDFDPFSFQLGAEWRSRRGLASDRLRPIAGVDVQIRQEEDWIPDVAVLLGLRLSNAPGDTRHVDLFLRGYRGRSLEGQFFRQKIELVGLGLRLGF